MTPKSERVHTSFIYAHVPVGLRHEDFVTAEYKQETARGEKVVLQL
jgi:predicted RNA-binding protein